MATSGQQVLRKCVCRSSFCCMGDVFMALQTGTITGGFINYDGMRLMKFDEAAPNLLVSKKLWYA